MAQASEQQSLHSAYIALPPRIKEWLSSDQIYFLLREITDRLGLKENKAAGISKLILRLAIQNLDPLDFINELAHELGTSFQIAKAIAEDIEHKVLKPIESDLRRDVGVDVKLIYFGKPSAQRAEPKLQGDEIGPIRPISPIGPIGGPTPAKIEVEQNVGKSDLPEEVKPRKVEAPKPLTAGPTEWERLRRETPPPKPEPISPIGPTEAATPFMLHQEGITYQPSPAKAERPEPMLNIKVKNYYAESPKKALPKPVAVQLEYADKQPRVVHYNETRTPLTNIGTPKTPPPTIPATRTRPPELPTENKVDLRKFTKPNSNTIDLRKKQ